MINAKHKSSDVASVLDKQISTSPFGWVGFPSLSNNWSTSIVLLTPSLSGISISSLGIDDTTKFCPSSNAVFDETVTSVVETVTDASSEIGTCSDVQSSL